MKNNKNLWIYALVAAVLTLLLIALVGNVAASKTAAGIDNELSNDEFFFWAEEFAEYKHYNEFHKLLEDGSVDDIYYCQTEEYMVVTIFNEVCFIIN